MIKNFRLCSLLLVACLLACCSSSEKLTAAQAAISHFRELMVAKKFDQIYAEGTAALKKATTAEQMTKFLAAVDQKLGAVKTAEQTGWSVKYGPQGTSVIAGLKTQFENGEAMETFAFQIENGKAILNGYNIRSNALILN